MRSPMRSPLRSPLRSPARSPARSLVPLPKWGPRQTLIDLYNEKERTQWYWRLSAVISAFMIMIGYECLMEKCLALEADIGLAFSFFRRLLSRSRI